METKIAHCCEAQYRHIGDICQTKNSSAAQERGAGAAGGENRHLKVRTTFFTGKIFFKTTRRKHFIFQSLSPQALQNIVALLSS